MLLVRQPLIRSETSKVIEIAEMINAITEAGKNGYVLMKLPYDTICI